MSLPTLEICDEDHSESGYVVLTFAENQGQPIYQMTYSIKEVLQIVENHLDNIFPQFDEEGNQI